MFDEIAKALEDGDDDEKNRCKVCFSLLSAETVQLGKITYLITKCTNQDCTEFSKERKTRV